MSRTWPALASRKARLAAEPMVKSPRRVRARCLSGWLGTGRERGLV